MTALCLIQVFLASSGPMRGERSPETFSQLDEHNAEVREQSAAPAPAGLCPGDRGRVWRVGSEWGPADIPGVRPA